MLLTVSEFIGHFHPVLVHLPIGILMMAIIFQWLSHKEKFSALRPAIRISLFFGMITSIIACVTGYLLSRTDDYDEQLVSWHQWMGIAVAAVSVIAYFLQRRQNTRRISIMFIGLFLLLTVTGHLGGSLTHGPDYLTSGFSSVPDVQSFRPRVENVQEAYAYNDLVQPILQNKCYPCHGKSKQKGGLRMDEPALLLKGGKDGVVLIPGKPGDSELIHRIMLPVQDEDHMPPKQKRQLKDNEIALLQWWVEQGASFSGKVKELPQSEKVKPFLLSFQTGIKIEEELPDIPSEETGKPDEKAIARLKEAGVVVMPVSANNNYVFANFVTASNINDSILSALQKVKNQLVWLKLGNTSINDTSLSVIGECDHLTRLSLDRTKITDIGLRHLRSLKNLQYLNLVGTAVTTEGVATLKDLKNLRVIFLYQTNVSKKDWMNLKKLFPKTTLDSGGYVVPLLPTDTSILTSPRKS